MLDDDLNGKFDLKGILSSKNSTGNSYLNHCELLGPAPQLRMGYGGYPPTTRDLAIIIKMGLVFLSREEN